MKVEKSTNEIISNSGNGHTFQINASASAFQILSSGIYSNKARAIVRELSTNAIDSHVAAGNDEPFEIKLPTSLDSTFYVRDFGTGLSMDDIMGYTDDNGTYHSGIYNTYFSSTKQDSNKFIGALGLGSKTPFCYTSNFLVISIYDGIKSTYSCFLNEDHCPSVTWLNSVETDEHNGLMVQFSVNQKDHYAFVQETENVIKYFSIKPTTNISIDRTSIEYTFEKSNWKYAKNRSSRAYVIQGGVSYPIDYQQLKGKVAENVDICFWSMPLDIFVEIGDVDVSASREHLSYTKKTIAFLANQFNSIYKDICDYIDEQFNGCDTLWSTLMMFKKMLHGEFRSVVCGYIVFNDLISKYANEVDGTITVDHIEFNNIKSTKITNYRWVHNKLEKVPTKTVQAFVSQGFTIIVDKHNYSRHQLTKLVENTKHNLVIVLKQTSRLKDADELDYLKKLLGNVYIETTKQPRIKSASKDANLTSVPCTEVVENGWSVNWQEADIDLSIGGFYVPYSRGFTYYNGTKVSDFNDIITKARLLGIINLGDKIYGMNHAKEKDLSSNWVNFFEHIVDNINHDSVDKMLAASELSNNYWAMKTVMNSYFNNTHFKDPIFNELHGVIEDIMSHTDSRNAKEHSLLVAMGINKRYSHALWKYLQKYSIIFEKYPMLQLIKFDNIYGTDNITKTYKLIKDYTNFLYATGKQA